MAIGTPGGNLSLKSRAQQITLNPNIIKVKNLLANVSLSFLIRESLLISQLNPVLNANIRSTPLELF